ncbi:16S RNA G1207 methylase RsmC [Tersicoccus solisilvae]|uniref:16S RNA G1207 methylase RsmC n=1 Tax=Tersicoccus solisilvae TaxID=1882339 RepID=A0ABQ1PE39_9MICC|nr:methyltransferase [Tersicoccus solisilvae]GGC95435.1 16S RNA G1207 methylase RsmC [Tersicoccus solisilvae]
MSEHYFSAQPSGPLTVRPLTVTLADRTVTVSTAGGVFSPDAVDKGTAVLLRNAPEPPATGRFLDLGCGWGPVALTLALRSPEAEVVAVDVNQRALELVRRNAAALGLAGLRAAEPGDVDPAQGFDLIWSNPPIRVGKEVLHGLLTTWLPRLNPGGTALLVVQKNLGADSLQRWLAGTLGEGFTVDRATTDKGFRILRVVRT